MTDQAAPPPFNPEPAPQQPPLEVRAEPYDPSCVAAPGMRTVDLPPSPPPAQPAPAAAAPAGSSPTSAWVPPPGAQPPPAQPPPSPTEPPYQAPPPPAPPGWGAGIPPAAAYPPPPAAPNQAWAMACHLTTLIDFGVPLLLFGLVPPLIIWLVKKDEDPEAAHAGKESLNFQLNLLFWSVAAFPLICLCGVGLLILFLIPIVKVVMVVIASIRTAEGARFRYPYIFRIIS